jgi:hypothetical protein
MPRLLPTPEPVRRLVPALLGAVLLLASSAGSAGAAALHVIPFPGTPDASPRAQIIFSSVQPSELRTVSVEGSESGQHSGRLIALSAGAGTAFLPDYPFDPGELVRVRAALSSAAAGTASGDPGATSLSFSFTIAVPAAVTSARTATHVPRLPAAVAPGGRTLSFRSAPTLAPAAVGVSSDQDPGAGDIFLTPKGDGIQGGPMILDPRGRLLWFMPISHPDAAFNLEVQRYRGQPVVTFWEGAVLDGYGQGHGVVMDSSYRTVAKVHAGEGYSADLHEFQITPQGTALLDAYVPVQADLSAVGGPTQGAVYDCVIQDVDIASGQVLWEWHSLGHIPLAQSHTPIPPSGPYQYLHLNSIQQLPDGNVLISGRNTWAVYLINWHTGHVIWTLGGSHSSFTMGPGTNFEWQHDARLDGDRMTLFDDADDPPEEPQSTAKVLSIDPDTRTASLVRSDPHSPSLLAASQGSAQALPDGNLFVGWGSEPYFSEYSAAGRQLFDGHFPAGMDSYRAYRFPWTGQPRTQPAMAVAQRGGGITAYASWNGATRVVSWCVLGGHTRATLKQLRCRPRTGFETTIQLPFSPAQLAVQALDSSGHVLGASAVRAGG